MRFLAAFVAAVSAFPQTHATPVAAQWFPADPAALAQLLARTIELAEQRAGAVPPRKNLVALVVPHAALSYSGITAAAAWRRAPACRNVILLAFSHRSALRGVAAPKLDQYQTPLGPVPVNRRALTELGVPLVEEASLCDHSLENQLPYLRRFLPGVPIVPLFVGALDEASRQSMARRLAARSAAGDLLVASSDFTHYGKNYGYTPFPLDEKTPARLRERAAEAFEHIGSLRVAAFDRFLETTSDTICGRDPIRLLMAALNRMRPEVFMETADYLCSGDLTRDYSTSVGYAALAFYPESAYQLNQQNTRKLLAVARQTLDSHLAGRTTAASPPPNAELGARGGVFVSIRKDGRMRGCVGALAPRTSLAETVAERTVAAATRDPRFKPLDPEEAPVKLELSLLSPLKRLPSWKEFRMGYGGVLLLGSDAGVLLPQVAREMNWNREQFLANLALKAGLEPHAYRDSKARLYVFRAQVVSED